MVTRTSQVCFVIINALLLSEYKLHSSQHQDNQSVSIYPHLHPPLSFEYQKNLLTQILFGYSEQYEIKQASLIDFLQHHPHYISRSCYSGTPFKKGQTVAHILANQNDWQLLERIIDQFGETCTARIRSYNPEYAYRGSTAFLILCFKKATSINQEKSVTRIAHKLLSRTPHLACIPRCDGMNAAHACTSQGPFINTSLLETLIHFCPKACIQETGSGYSAATFLINRQASPAAITALYTLMQHDLIKINEIFMTSAQQTSPEFKELLKINNPSLYRLTNNNSCLCCIDQCYCCQNQSGPHKDYWRWFYQQNQSTQAQNVPSVPNYQDNVRALPQPQSYQGR